MKQIFKKPSYYLLSQAMDGDEKAIEKILAFYDPYISKCCRSEEHTSELQSH